ILVRENLDMVRAFLLAAVRDPAVADDLAQEAFLAAWKNLDRYDRTLPFGPWVRGIAAKLVLTHQRRRARSKLVFWDTASLTVLEERFDHLQHLPGDTFDDRMDALRRCLSALTATQREVIRLHYEEGLGCQAIATRTGLGVEAVKKHLQLGRLALMRCIDCRTRERREGTG